MKKYKIEKEHHRMKISQYLREIQNYSGRSLRNIEIFLNGKRVKTTKKLPSSGILKVCEKEKQTNIKPIDLNIKIVYEDDDLLIVNKKPFLLTHPTLKKVDYTLANGIVFYFLKKYGKTLVPRFYNRLDMNTSGLIIITKNSFAQAFLQNMGNLEKKYLAIVKGIIDEKEIENIVSKNENTKIEDKKIVIEQPIYRDGDNLQRTIDSRGKYAKTIIKPLKTYPKKNITLVECELFTGRTHQIRVHTKSIGHAIVGDELYGDGLNEQNGIKRQFLHAYKIKFLHPSQKKEMTVEIPIFEDMKNFLEN